MIRFSYFYCEATDAALEELLVTRCGPPSSGSAFVPLARGDGMSGVTDRDSVPGLFPLTEAADIDPFFLLLSEAELGLRLTGALPAPVFSSVKPSRMGVWLREELVEPRRTLLLRRLRSPERWWCGGRGR
jgi:hypothetical protein